MKKIALLISFLFLTLAAFSQTGMHKRSHFALFTSFLNDDENPEIEIYPNVSMAIQHSGDATAVMVSPSDRDIWKITQLSNLRTIYLDHNFTLENYYISKAEVAKFFKLIAGIERLQFVSVFDPKLLPLLADNPNLKGLIIRNFDPLVFNKVAAKLAPQLEVLVIDDAGCNFLPPSVCTLAALKQLELNSRNFGGLPDSIGNLSALKVLRIDGGSYDHVPESFSRLSGLQYVHLEGGPKSPKFLFPISHLQSLIEVHLNINGLQSIPDTFSSLVNASSVYLCGAGKLKELPKSISALKALKELYVGDASHLVYFGGIDSLGHAITLLMDPPPSGKLQMAAILANKNIATLAVSEEIKPGDFEKLKKQLPGKNIVKRKMDDF